MGSSEDKRWMLEALRFARRARLSGQAIPGAAVVVKEGNEIARSVGCGARAVATVLEGAGTAAAESTLYASVWDEESSEAARCIEALKEARVARVVVGMVDPGSRADRLRAVASAGIELAFDVLLDECWDLAAGALVARERQRPMVVAKFATSIDGRIATRTGESRWITGPEARRRGHELRRDSGAIVVGTGTVAADDPQLTTRLADETDAQSPLRVVVSSRPVLPEGAKLLDTVTADTVVFHSIRSPDDERVLHVHGVETVLAAGVAGKVDPRAVIDRLFARGINRVLLEGGSGLIATFVDAGLVDRVVHFQAPILIGGAGAKSCLSGTGVGSLSDAIRGLRTRVLVRGADLELTIDFRAELLPIRLTASTG
jgi:diaminohydroxyphosphoribosylaminopyrimidine deaminase/5-amino-6-(5-phosphoribosylamino)uracil reductase